jgi:aminoglycoside phosphotransferase
MDLHELISSRSFRDDLDLAYRDQGLAGIRAVTPEVTYVRFKPGTGCLFGLEVRGLDGETHDGYVKVFFEGSPAVPFEKYRTRAKGDGWVALLPSVRSLYFHFPLDRAVIGLPYVAEMQKLKHVLHEAVPELSPGTTRVRAKRSSLTLIKYKPERRCIVRADLGLTGGAAGEGGRMRIIAQASADEGAAHVFRLMVRLSERGDEGRHYLRVPKPLGYDAAKRILIQEWVEGEPLGLHLAESNATDACGLAARGLRELHRLPILDLPRRGPEFYLAHARQVMDDLSSVGPGLRSELARIREKLETAFDAAPSRAPSLVHGDFYYNQLLVAGEQCTLIDWDEAHVGDPLSDVGNFVAHLHLRDVQGLLDPVRAWALRDIFLGNYFRHERRPPELAAFVALHLLELAVVPFRNLSVSWEEESGKILTRVRSLLWAPEAQEVRG